MTLSAAMLSFSMPALAYADAAGTVSETQAPGESSGHYTYEAPSRGGGPGEVLAGGSSAAGIAGGAPGSTAVPGAAGSAEGAPGTGSLDAGSQTGAENMPGGAAVGTPGAADDGVQLIDPSGNVSTGSSGPDFSDLSLGKEAGAVQEDDILHLSPFVHAQLLLSNGQLTEGFTSNMDAFSSPEDGFCGLRLRLENGVGDIYYRVYTAEHGWSKWAMNEMDTPYEGDGAKVQAVQIRTKGYTRNLYDVYYRAVLNDGTVLDWAHDGQTAGTMGTDRYIQSLEISLWKNGMRFWQKTANHMTAENYEGIVQEADGSLRYQTFNGAPYTGWAYDTQNHKYYFKDSIPVTGWQYLDGYKYYFDESGKVVTDLEPVIGLQKEYKLKLNKDMKTLTVYAKDGKNGFIMPVKVILTTVGPATPIGTYKTYQKYRWKFMHDNIYCQYLARFYNGFLLHSAIYEDAPDSYHFNAGTYNYMGKIQSDGCVRMVAGDAAWVYEHCKTGTEITIYNDEWTTGPFDRPAIEQAIPMDQNYDPTDPEVKK